MYLLCGISMAMAVRQCNTVCISQLRRSRAFIKATKCNHRVTTRSVLPRWLPGQQKTKQQCKILMAVVVRRLYTPHIDQWRWFVAFLKATEWRHWASTCSDITNRTCLPRNLVVYFIVKSTKKGSMVMMFVGGVVLLFDGLLVLFLL